jgi:hypothetical protein
MVLAPPNNTLVATQMTVAVTTTCNKQYTRETKAAIAVHKISAVIYTQQVRCIAATNY